MQCDSSSMQSSHPHIFYLINITLMWQLFMNALLSSQYEWLEVKKGEGWKAWKGLKVKDKKGDRGRRKEFAARIRDWRSIFSETRKRERDRFAKLNGNVRTKRTRETKARKHVSPGCCCCKWRCLQVYLGWLLHFRRTRFFDRRGRALCGKGLRSANLGLSDRSQVSTVKWKQMFRLVDPLPSDNTSRVICEYRRGDNIFYLHYDDRYDEISRKLWGRDLFLEHARRCLRISPRARDNTSCPRYISTADGVIIHSICIAMVAIMKPRENCGGGIFF